METNLPALLSAELKRIADLMQACSGGEMPLPAGLVIHALRLCELSAAMQEIELALFRGTVSAEEAKPKVAALLARQRSQSGFPCAALSGGRLQ
jgi:hypothetical protein